MAESTVAVESDSISSSQRENGVAVREATMTMTIAMTARLVSLKGLALPCGAVVRNAPAVECYCCREMAEVEERLEGGDSCVTALDAHQLDLQFSGEGKQKSSTSLCGDCNMVNVSRAR